MAYTEKKKTDVKEAIKLYTDQYFERFTQDDVIKQAMDAMDANKSAIQVADAVYDYVYDKNCDNVTFSTLLPQCMPKDVLLILRNEIIKVLS